MPDLCCLPAPAAPSGSFITASLYCVASDGLLSGDAERVQMLLVLTTGTSYVLGGCISWLWVLFGS